MEVFFMRLEGFSPSGIDVEEIVNAQIKIEKQQLIKIEQDKQLLEWKVESYRSVVADLNSFRTDFFDILKKDNYLLSENSFNIFNAVSSNETYVTATASTGAIAGKHEVSIKQLATSGRVVSGDTITKEVAGTIGILDDSGFVSAQGKSFVLSLNGSSRTITLDETVTNLTSFQALIDDAVGEQKVSVTKDGSGIMKFNAVNGSGINHIRLIEGGALSHLGFNEDSNYSNRLNRFETLETLDSKTSTSIFGGAETLEFTINGEAFSFAKDTTLTSLISTVNASDAKVTMRYNELTDDFEVISDEQGAGNTVKFTQQSGSFLESMKLVDGNGDLLFTEGDDAQAIIDGVEVTSASNTFTAQGVTFTFNKVHQDPNTESESISLTRNSESLFDKVENFVNRYNSLIETLNGKLSERYDNDFRPLTEEQKEAMSEEEIKLWEGKAKTGLLGGDGLLSSMVTSMRSVLYQSITGVTGGLHSIGIKTGSYEKRGQLEIDPIKLREAIDKNPDLVKNIFTAGTEDSATGQKGIARRVKSIIDSYVRTTRDSSGRKGLLLERAGMEGDSSVSNNQLYTQLMAFDRRITVFNETIERKENAYYVRYSRFESMMYQMMEQGNSLLSQLGLG